MRIDNKRSLLVKARRQLLVNPKNTFASVKRVIGKTAGEVKKKNSIAINDHAAMKVSNRIAHNATLSMFCPAVERNFCQRRLVPKSSDTCWMPQATYK